MKSAHTKAIKAVKTVKAWSTILNTAWKIVFASTQAQNENLL